MPYQATNGLGLRHQLSNAVAGAIDTPRSLRVLRSSRSATTVTRDVRKP